MPRLNVYSKSLCTAGLISLNVKSVNYTMNSRALTYFSSIRINNSDFDGDDKDTGWNDEGFYEEWS